MVTCKYLIMCEGNNEKAIINLLLENNLLIFSKNDLLGLDIYHARQLAPYLINVIKTYNSNNFTIIRIGDKLSDKLTIPDSIKYLITQKQIVNCRTHPELEMLLIVHNNLLNKYLKVKSKVKAKEFAKQNIPSYDASSDFWRDYYKDNPQSLVNDIKKCHKIGKNKKDEIYLSDLLK